MDKAEHMVVWSGSFWVAFIFCWVILMNTIFCCCWLFLGPFGWLKSQRCLAGSACVGVLLGLLLLAWCVAGLAPACVVCCWACSCLRGVLAWCAAWANQPAAAGIKCSRTGWNALENCMAWTLDSGQMELSFAEHVDSGMLLFCWVVMWILDKSCYYGCDVNFGLILFWFIILGWNLISWLLILGWNFVSW